LLGPSGAGDEAAVVTGPTVTVETRDVA